MRSDHRLLAVAVAVAVLFGAGWLWRAADDRITRTELVPAGEPVQLDRVEYRLASLATPGSVPSGFDELVTPLPDAVLVLARIDYDATARTEPLYCGFQLVAGELIWKPHRDYYPADPDTGSCAAGRAGTATVLFEIPQHLLGQVQGVGVLPGDDRPLPVLQGRPG